MASDDDDGNAPREPLTPFYSPPSRPGGGAETPGRRPTRHGPLGARLSQRNRVTEPPASGMETPYSSYTSGTLETGETPPATASDYVPSAPPNPTWGRVTGLLKLDEKVTGALRADVRFGSTWSSRSEMLRACLDEYYRLVASYNEARRLLELSDGDIEELRREQVAANMRLREVESRLEFHSRTELRAVYLGAAETETRLFRAEEERELLRSRAELLEGFMAFLSRIIATVRAIPPNVVINGDTPAPSANGATPGLPAGVNPDETLLYNSAGSRRPAAPATPAPAGVTHASSGPAAEPGHEIEELVLDENEVALLASSEFEIIEILDDESAATSAGGKSEAGASANGASADAGHAETVTSGKAASDVVAGSGPAGGVSGVSDGEGR